MGMIQIRNVPPELHRKLKSRAAESGMSLSDYLLAEVERVARIPTLEEMRERLRSLPPVKLDRAPHEILREIRDAGE
jgi:hypothetical protein